MHGAAVSFRNIAKRYGSVVALEDFTLEVQPGEFVTLLGPSGSGKSTALNILAGFTDPTEGQLTVAGRDVLAMPPERRNVGMVFQSYSLFPHMDVFDNVAFPLKLRKVSRAEIQRRVASALEMVQLPGYERRRPSELSGGQRQRVAFARAVVFEPAVLLMDEPLGALDLKLREAMQAEIKRYHRQLGCTIVFVTHDQGEALALSDRIAVMGQARIAQIGTPEDIYDRPVSRYVAQFIGRTNALELLPMGQRRWQLPGLGLTFDEPAQDAPWPAEAAALCLRPEHLRRADGRSSALEFEAQVSEVTFLGDHTLYLLRTRQAAELQLHESRGAQAAPLRRGDQVRLAFDPTTASALSGPVHAASSHTPPPGDLP
ncbi:MAG: ABC transporter ATP-binding protein [Rubrivivax sp.]|nr:ABC transporter ATP-binding protein [Rubrivivax sp.]